MTRILKPLTLSIITVLSLSAAEPPATWQEHWFEHNQLLQNVFTDSDVAVYFDPDVDRSITWPNKYIGDVWRHTKRIYGNFGEENNLYAIFHTGKYPGGHPSTYFDSSHDFRNVIDCGSTFKDAWISAQGNDLDLVTHEIAHVVELASKGVHKSPALAIWGDSKWAEIFIYDVYRGLGMTTEKTRWYNMMIQNHDNFPRENTYWFRDWFYPIYSNYGGSAVLNNFFVVLSQNFPRIGNTYRRSMNMGEFVHFWSGAAGSNLKDVATTAFGWTAEYDSQFKQARSDFPYINYR